VAAGFEVDCEALVRAAHELRSMRTDLLDAVAPPCELWPGQFDDLELVTAIRYFDDSSRQAVHVLADDAAAVADGLVGNATRYREAQQHVTATLAGLAD